MELPIWLFRWIFDFHKHKKSKASDFEKYLKVLEEIVTLEHFKVECTSLISEVWWGIYPTIISYVPYSHMSSTVP